MICLREVLKFPAYLALKELARRYRKWRKWLLLLYQITQQEKKNKRRQHRETQQWSSSWSRHIVKCVSAVWWGGSYKLWPENSCHWTKAHRSAYNYAQTLLQLQFPKLDGLQSTLYHLETWMWEGMLVSCLDTYNVYELKRQKLSNRGGSKDSCNLPLVVYPWNLNPLCTFLLHCPRWEWHDFDPSLIPIDDQFWRNLLHLNCCLYVKKKLALESLKMLYWNFGLGVAPPLDKPIL